MNLSTVTAAYFSPTDTTKKAVEAIAQGISPDFKRLDLTPAASREQSYSFGPEDLLVIGAPVYGGRIPLPRNTRKLHTGSAGRGIRKPRL